MVDRRPGGGGTEGDGVTEAGGIHRPVGQNE